MSQKCGDGVFSTDPTVCLNIPNCDVPLNNATGNCICADGYSMRPDNTCGPSCTNTVYNSATNNCAQLPNCTAPTSGSGNCTCLSGLKENRLGVCTTTCENTQYISGQPTSCTDIIGCRVNNNACKCYQGAYGPPKPDGSCVCHPSAVDTVRRWDCACPPGKYFINEYSPTRCDDCPANQYSERTGYQYGCERVPQGGIVLANRTGITCSNGYRYVPATFSPNYTRSTCQMCDVFDILNQTGNGRIEQCQRCYQNSAADRNRTRCECNYGFVQDGDTACKCPPGKYYINGTIPPGHNGPSGQCQPCDNYSYLVNTSGYVTQCLRCPTNMLSHSNRTSCYCKTPFIDDPSNNNCKCPPGHYYHPPTGQVGDCYPCNSTSIRPNTTNLPQDCILCPLNMEADNNRTQCVCKSPFIRDGNSCKCPAGHYYTAPTGQNRLGTCTKCGPNFILPDTSNYQSACTKCPTDFIGNPDRTACVCGSPLVADGNSCKCPVGYKYSSPANGVQVGTCTACGAYEILANTSGRPTSCNQCQTDMIANQNRSQCICGSPLIPDGNNCKCPPGKKYTAPTNTQVGQCTTCGIYEILPNTSGKPTACTLCPRNKQADSNRTQCLCAAPFINDTNDQCKCPEGHKYNYTTGQFGTCTQCNYTSILPYTSGYPTECMQCPDNMVADGTRTSCQCQSSFIRSENGTCLCNRGYFYTAGTNGHPGSCTMCNQTSIIPYAGLKTECTKCPSNQLSDKDRIECSCGPGFVKTQLGCMCDAGYRYVPASGAILPQCKPCIGNTYLDSPNLNKTCDSCGDEATANKNHTTCFCKDKSVFRFGVCQGSCIDTVYQVSASCRGAIGCTWPYGIFGFCRCNTEKGFVENQDGNCECPPDTIFDEDNEACISLKASPWLPAIYVALAITFSIAAIICLMLIRRKRAAVINELASEQPVSDTR